jgi:hypothetical protein
MSTTLLTTVNREPGTVNQAKAVRLEPIVVAYPKMSKPVHGAWKKQDLFLIKTPYYHVPVPYLSGCGGKGAA